MVSTQDPSQTRCPGCPRWDREWLPACSLKQMTSEQRGLEGRGCKDTMTLLKIKHYLLPRNHGVHGLGGFKKDPTGWPHKCLENPWILDIWYICDLILSFLFVTPTYLFTCRRATVLWTSYSMYLPFLPLQSSLLRWAHASTSMHCLYREPPSL